MNQLTSSNHTEMKYINKTTGHFYNGGAMTKKVGNTVFTGIPTSEQLQAWGYEEIVPESNELTEKLLRAYNIQNQIYEIQNKLYEMDYLTSKYIDGEDMTKYGDWLQLRRLLREQYRLLENQLNENV